MCGAQLFSKAKTSLCICGVSKCWLVLPGFVWADIIPMRESMISCLTGHRIWSACTEALRGVTQRSIPTTPHLQPCAACEGSQLTLSPVEAHSPEHARRTAITNATASVVEPRLLEMAKAEHATYNRCTNVCGPPGDTTARKSLGLQMRAVVICLLVCLFSPNETTKRIWYRTRWASSMRTCGGGDWRIRHVWSLV